MGWMKTTEQRQKEKAAAGPKFYMLWETDTDKEKMRRIHDHVSAPKRDLPGMYRYIFPMKVYSVRFQCRRYFTEVLNFLTRQEENPRLFLTEIW